MEWLAVVLVALALILLPFRNRIVPAWRRALAWITAVDGRMAALCGIVDGVSFISLGVWLFSWARLRETGEMIETAVKVFYYKPVLLLPLGMAIAAVYWRGNRDARRILAGGYPIIRLTFEGFLGTASLPVFAFLIRLAPMAYAGLPMHLEARTWELGGWFTALGRMLQQAGTFGLIGAAFGLAMGGVNKLIVSWLMTNQTGMSGEQP